MELYRDNSEHIPYDTPEMPIYIRRGLLSGFPGYTMLSHWHNDIEFIVPLCGKMDYSVNGVTYELVPGNGIMINSCQLHSGFSENEQECEYICVLLHPLLLCANETIEEAYVAPVIANAPCVLFSRQTKWHSEILDAVGHIYDCREKPHQALTIQSLFYRIWDLLYENLGSAPEKAPKESNNLSALKSMVGYIQKHYSEKMSLDEISAAGKVCKSSCCSIFRDYLHRTPISYLTDYRIGKSIELLQIPQKSITEIAYESGFSGTSYYTETFRKLMGKTPTDFRHGQR